MSLGIVIKIFEYLVIVSNGNRRSLSPKPLKPRVLSPHNLFRATLIGLSGMETAPGVEMTCTPSTAQRVRPAVFYVCSWKSHFLSGALLGC